MNLDLMLARLPRWLNLWDIYRTWAATLRQLVEMQCQKLPVQWDYNDQTKPKQLQFRKCCVDVSGILETLNQLDIDNPEKERFARSYACATRHHQNTDCWRFRCIGRQLSGFGLWGGLAIPGYLSTAVRSLWAVDSWVSCNTGTHQNFYEILVRVSACQDYRAFCSIVLKLKVSLREFMIYYSSAKRYFWWLPLQHASWWSMCEQASHWLRWRKPKACSNSLSTMSTVTFFFESKWSWIISSLEGNAVFTICLAVLPCHRRSSNCKLECCVALGSILHVQTVIEYHPH